MWIKSCRVLFTTAFLSVLSLGQYAFAVGIDLNSASKTELEALPGIGSKMADDIIAARPFKNVDDLKNIKGIGDAKLEKLKPLVAVGDQKASSVVPQAMAPKVPEPAAAAPEIPAVPEAAAVKSAAIPKTPDVKGAVAQKTGLAPGEIIHLNTASLEQLAKLPGIGPKKAEAIIAGRPYKTTEDLMKVKGIKTATFEKIKGFVDLN